MIEFSNLGEVLSSLSPCLVFGFGLVVLVWLVGYGIDSLFTLFRK